MMLLRLTMMARKCRPAPGRSGYHNLNSLGASDPQLKLVPAPGPPATWSLSPGSEHGPAGGEARFKLGPSYPVAEGPK